MKFSRSWDDLSVHPLTKDEAFNRHSFGLRDHVSPFDNDEVLIGMDDIKVRLISDFTDEEFKKIMSYTTQATIGTDPDSEPDLSDWDEMLKGGLQTALEAVGLVFAISGVSRTATHQIVRQRKAAFHQQSQRAVYMGRQPQTRMPESIWRNLLARNAFIKAMSLAHEAYQAAVSEDISYQDARFILPEGTCTSIVAEMSLREFLAVYEFRACSMTQWEHVNMMRQMGVLVVEAHPWLAPYVKITCEKTTGSIDRGNDGTPATAHTCRYQGWEAVEKACDFPWARESNRTFQPKFHKIERKPV